MPSYDIQRVRSMLPPPVKNVDELTIQCLWTFARTKAPIKTTEDFISWITRNSEHAVKFLTPYKANHPAAACNARNGIPSLF